ncbi:MAG: epoxide hydrolase [Nocardioides sp.]|nr:epoxide hydrolase [Nocardioides sp.]
MTSSASPTPSGSSDASEATDVVLAFLGALEARDMAGVTDLLDAQAEWRNTGLPTLRGPRVAGTLRALDARGIGVEVTMRHIAATGDVVLTDRTDVITWGRWRAGFRVSGTFEVRHGKVRLWDDHFSATSALGASVAGVVRAVVGR